MPLTASLVKRGGADTVLRLRADGPVNVTVTDAALELLLHTRDEWLAQRRNQQQQQQASEPSSGGRTQQAVAVPVPLSPPPASRSPAATSPPRPGPLLRDASSSTTWSALSYTHRSSGAGVGNSGGRGSPYVLQNLTGLPLTFWTVQQESASAATTTSTSSSGRLSTSQHLAVSGRGRRRDPAAHAMELDAPAGSRTPFAVWQHLLHDGGSETYRREYESVHSVFVRMHGPPPLDGAELTCLPMTRVGHYSYSLRPGGGGRGAEGRARSASREQMGGRKEIVWSVAVEAGRRILTLRSALEVVNRAGLDLQLR